MSDLTFAINSSAEMLLSYDLVHVCIGHISMINMHGSLIIAQLATYNIGFRNAPGASIGITNLKSEKIFFLSKNNFKKLIFLINRFFRDTRAENCNKN